eukprot:g70323.t1
MRKGVCNCFPPPIYGTQPMWCGALLFLLSAYITRAGDTTEHDKASAVSAVVAQQKASVDPALYLEENQRASDGECLKVFPAFCTNVDWMVPKQDVDYATNTEADLQSNILWSTFEGTRDCRLLFRDLQCRYIYPHCEHGRPCRSECEAFTQKCRGALQSCASFPTEDCYKLESAASHNLYSNSLLCGLLLLVLLWKIY